MTVDALGGRRAALLLHGLPPNARQQVLANLRDEDRLLLQPLLEELTELGISRVTPASASDCPRESGSHASALERAAGLSPDAAARGLALCGALTAARLIQARSWPWKESLLSHMPEPLRSSVVAGLRHEFSRLPPALLSYLCERLCTEASRLAPRASGMGKSWRRLLKWTR
jgi:hypothetical protein